MSSFRNKKKTPIGDENISALSALFSSTIRNKKKTPIGDENFNKPIDTPTSLKK